MHNVPPEQNKRKNKEKKTPVIYNSKKKEKNNALCESLTYALRLSTALLSHHLATVDMRKKFTSN